MNTVLKNVRLGPGEAILVSDHSYGGAVYACESVCARVGCRLVSAHIRLPRAPTDAALTADEIVSAFEQALVDNPDVRLVVIGMDCFWINGSRFSLPSTYTVLYCTYTRTFGTEREVLVNCVQIRENALSLNSCEQSRTNLVVNVVLVYKRMRCVYWMNSYTYNT